MNRPEDIKIVTWAVSFYHNQKRKWMYGMLKVTPESLEFVENDSHDPPYTKKIHHSEIKEVKKSMTGLIYKAVIINLKDQSKHWISSLSDQTCAYNVLQYFQRQHLFSYKNVVSFPRSKGMTSTEMGQKLLNSVIDSQNTLNKAVNVLHEQGSQLDSSSATMIDIHNDLDIADSILSGLETWLCKWKIPQQYKKESLEIILTNDLPDELDYEILYTKLEIGKMTSQNLGILRVCAQGVLILTDKQKIVYNFKWNDVSIVKVLSLCEIMIARYLIGQPDLTFDIVCTNLLPIIRLLDRRLKSKMEYSTEIFKEEKPMMKLKKESLSKMKEKLYQKEENQDPQKDGLSTPNDPDVIAESSGSDMTLNAKCQGQKLVVSDQEVDEISQTLQNIKSIAIATGQELDIQNDKIDKLNSTVEKANERLLNNEKRMQKMLYSS